MATAKKKPGKQTEIKKKSVMRDMRRLALLFIWFQEKVAHSAVTFASMFQRQYFGELDETIDEITSKEEKTDAIKTGLKLGLCYLILKAA